MTKPERVKQFRNEAKKVAPKFVGYISIDRVVELMDEAYLTGHIRGKMEMARYLGTAEARHAALKRVIS